MSATCVSIAALTPRGHVVLTDLSAGMLAVAGANATARQVTYTANLEVDHKALRAQVFNEGWRIMKNRFYDGEMHGADWPAAKKTYEPLLDYLVDEEELVRRKNRRAPRTN